MLNIIMYIGAFFPGLIGKDVSVKTAKVIGVVILAIMVFGIVYGGHKAYIASKIAEHDAEIRADNAEAARSADIAADAAQQEALAEALAEQRVLEAKASEAAKADPTGAAKSVGPVSKSYYDNLPEK